MLVAPLRNSMRMYEAGAQLGAGNGTGTNVIPADPHSGHGAVGAALCTTLALM